MTGAAKALRLGSAVVAVGLGLVLAAAEQDARGLGAVAHPGPSPSPGSVVSAPPVVPPPPPGQTPGMPLFDQRLEWPLVALQADKLWLNSMGSGVKIAELDTGIDARNPDLSAAVLPSSRSLIGQPPGRRVTAVSDPHGTIVAGLIAARGSRTADRQVVGLAPRASLIDIQVEARQGPLAPGIAAAGIATAVRAGAQVINISLGVRSGSAALWRALAFARARHCAIVVAAGRPGEPQALAGRPGVLVVVASGMDSAPSSAPTLTAPGELFAPGVNLESTGLAVPGQAWPSVQQVSGNGYAAAYVSAALALLISADHLAPSKAASLLATTTTTASGNPHARIIDPLAALKRGRRLGRARRSRHRGGNSGPGRIKAGGQRRFASNLLALPLTILAMFMLAWLLVRGRWRRKVRLKTADHDVSARWDASSWEGSSWDETF